MLQVQDNQVISTVVVVLDNIYVSLSLHKEGNIRVKTKRFVENSIDATDVIIIYVFHSVL